jgi:RHS repeat-associated protein
VAVTNVDGSIAARYEYDAYGNLLTQSGSSAQPFGFTGYQTDTDTGLYYANARYYDSETARFNREDPFDGDVNTPPSLHRYLYANANPNFYVDPTGRCNEAYDNFSFAGCAEQAEELRSFDDPKVEILRRIELEAAPVAGIAEAGVDAVKGTLELASQISATLGEGLSGGYFYEGSARNLRNTLDSISNGIAHPLDTIQQANQIHNAKVAAFEQAGNHAAATQERFRYGANWAASIFGIAKTIQTFAKNSPKIVVESPDNKLNLNNIEVLSIRDARRLEGDNQGLIFVKEPQGNLNQFFEQFDAGTTGAFSETITQKRAVPALRFDNPNPRGNNFVKFDGIELNTNTVIDRKTNLTTRPKQLQSLQRASGALKRNPNFNGVFEFPNQKAADKAINILRQQNITNIIVRVVESE